MTYAVPAHRRPSIETALDALEGVASVVLTTHVNADGDGIGCQAALMALLETRGIETWIVNPTTIPATYRFLIPDQTRVLDAGTEEAARRCLDAHLCLIVDTGEVPRIGRVNPMVEGIPKLVIDHHPPGERPFPGIGFVDPAAAAAGELVFDLIQVAGGPWSPAVVEGLYVAILTDTGSFRFSNSTPAAHRVAAELIALGASPDVLYRAVYGSFPLRRFKLLREALATLETAHDGRVAWMVVPPAAYRELGCRSDDLEGLIDVPREVEGAEVAIIFRELDDGTTKISFRSNGEADVNRLAQGFDGGGHQRASGALVHRSLEETVPLVVRAARAVLPGEGAASRRAPAEP